MTQDSELTNTMIKVCEHFNKLSDKDKETFMGNYIRYLSTSDLLVEVTNRGFTIKYAQMS